MTRNFIIFLVQSFFKLFADIQIKGEIKKFEGSPAIIVANHIGSLDGAIVLAINSFIRHPNLIVVVAEKYQKYLIIRWAVKHMGFMFIDRFNPNIRTLRVVIKRLKKNGLLILAPEGTRSPTGSLIEGKQGAAYLAAKSGATLTAITTVGSSNKDVWSQWKKLHRPKVTLRVGAPFTLREMPKKGRKEFLAESTNEIMCQIAALLPITLRGLYTDNPRLKEILDGKSILVP